MTWNKWSASAPVKPARKRCNPPRNDMKKLIASLLAAAVVALGVVAPTAVLAQNAPAAEMKKMEMKKDEAKKDEAKAADAAKPEEKKADAAPAAPAPVPNKGDVAWMLTSTALVLLMSVPALALFYGGLVRTKNMLSV